MRQKSLLILALVGLTVGLYLGNQNPGKSEDRMISFGGIQWIADYDQALKISEEKSKPVLIYFWRRGCTWCAKMESEVFPTHEVSETISKHFVAVALDINNRKNFETMNKYGVYATPTFVIVDGEKKAINIGYMDIGEFLEFLNPHVKNREIQFQSGTT